MRKEQTNVSLYGNILTNKPKDMSLFDLLYKYDCGI